MKELTVYIADDGTKFKNFNDCSKYEGYLEKTQRIMSQLNTRKEGSSFAVRQNVELVKQCMEKFFNEVAKPLLNNKMLSKLMDDTIAGKAHMSHIARYFDDSQYPLLYSTYFRFVCINMKSGIEYEQPYFVNHEDEFKGTIE
jgi:hypothetical protein